IPMARGWNVEVGWSKGPTNPESVMTNSSAPVRVSKTALPGTGLERVALSQYPFTNAWNGVPRTVAGHHADVAPDVRCPTRVRVFQGAETLYEPATGFVTDTLPASRRPRFRNVPIPPAWE